MNIENEIDLVELIEDIRNQGYKELFSLENNQFCAIKSNSYYQPQHILLEKYYRLKGQVGKEENLIVFLITCNDGTKGYLLSPYEPRSRMNLLTTMDKVKIRKRDPLRLTGS